MTRDAYRDAGVDIDAGDALVDRIKPLAAATLRAGVVGGIGGFGGLFALDGRYRDPVLVSGTDGVGTKLLVAQRLGVHDTVGVDLGGDVRERHRVFRRRTLFFLDYFATGKLDVGVAEAVIAGVANGCRQAGCALLGGETAEMPGMYGPGHYDLAGFAVGVVERDAILTGADVVAGDVLVGVPSSGLHSNGYSLVRRLLDDLDPAAEHGLGEPLGDVLLRPTRIYAKALLAARPHLKAVSHITGGGLPGNVPRMLPEGLGARLERDSWRIPPIFELLRRKGELTEPELLRTFNCGLGLVVATSPDRADALCAALDGVVVGEVVVDPAQDVVVA